MKKREIMYCPECGTRIDGDGVHFCPECGTKIESWCSPVTNEDMKSGDDSGPGNVGQERYAAGLILTNVKLLSEKLGTGKDAVLAVLDRFVSRKRQHGISYRLVDAGCHLFGDSSSYGEGEVHLDERSPLEDYMSVLMDAAGCAEDDGQGCCEYLFIIGGEDIVPMPAVKNYLPADNGEDKDVDTDLLYAYPYGGEMVEKMENMEIFGYEQMFLVGRLPIGSDGTLDDLSDYLDRDIAVSDGLPVSKAYGQCDPNWRNVSLCVAGELAGEGMLPDLDGYPDQYHYHGLAVSPMVTDGNIGQIMDMSAGLYYFNMHGSNALGSRGYYGQSLPAQGREWYSGILPEQMMQCRIPNAVVSEACYGARFKGMDKMHSMLLASMGTGTMLFVGASRIAWGSVDTAGSVSGNASISNADVIASAFMKGMLEGMTAGEAFLYARYDLFKRSGYGDLHAALTAVEFNLFGDPALHFSVKGQRGTGQKTSRRIVPEGTVKAVSSVEKIFTDSRGSLLDMVRNAVNCNVMRINHDMARYLYDVFGISARTPDSVLKIRYHGGEEELQFTYHSDIGGTGDRRLYMVASTLDGKVRKVYTTK